MPTTSAGILLFRHVPHLEVLLVHPGGPFWKNKDEGAWTIPKGELGPGEEAEACARREFFEEIGMAVDAVAAGPLRPLPAVRQKAGKLVIAFACRGDLDPASIQSNTFRLEWPPRSGRFAEFPEVDRAGWFSVEVARGKINPAQSAWLDLLDAVAHADGVQHEDTKGTKDHEDGASKPTSPP